MNHLLRMTDSTGVFQHAIFGVPNFFEGYCTDDNARAFILAVLLGEFLVNSVDEAVLAVERFREIDPVRLSPARPTVFFYRDHGPGIRRGIL